MIAAFDASVLLYLFSDDAGAPLDAATGKPVEQCQQRVTHLLAELQKAKAKIVIPSPALAEVLVYGEAEAPEWLRVLSTSKHFRIAPFDERAAVEYAAMERERSGRSSAAVARRKAKFDEQIVAIAAIEQADVIYSDDSDIKQLAGNRMSVLGVAELATPPVSRQGALQFEPIENARIEDEE